MLLCAALSVALTGQIDQYLQNGQFGVARAKMEAALANAPQDLHQLRQLTTIGAASPARTGEIALRLGRLSANPADRALAAITVANAGRPSEAYALLHDISGVASDRSTLLYARGTTLAVDGRPEAALRDYLAAIEADPLHYDASRAAQRLLTGRGDTSHALRLWAKRFHLDTNIGLAIALAPLLGRTRQLWESKIRTTEESRELSTSLLRLGLIEEAIAVHPDAGAARRHLQFQQQLVVELDLFYASPGDDMARAAFWKSFARIVRDTTDASFVNRDNTIRSELCSYILDNYHAFMRLPRGVAGLGGEGADPGEILYFQVLHRERTTAPQGRRQVEVLHLGDDLAASRQNRYPTLLGGFHTGTWFADIDTICINHSALVRTCGGLLAKLQGADGTDLPDRLRAMALNQLAGGDPMPGQSTVARYYAVKSASSLQHELAHVDLALISPITQEACAILAEFADGDPAALIACADLLHRAQNRDLAALEALSRLGAQSAAVKEALSGRGCITNVPPSELRRGARAAKDDAASRLSATPAK